MPSYGGAHGPDGSKKSGDQGQGSRDSRGGQTGGMGGGFGGGFGGRGTASQQQDRHNLANAHSRGNIAPGVGMGSATDSRARNSRYNQNLIASGPMTTHNMMELGKMMPGPGMVARGIGAIAGIKGPLGGPSFEGVSPRSATGYSYDGPNRFTGTGGNGGPRVMPPPSMTAARAQALGPVNPIQAPAWWRTPFPGGV